MDEDDRLIHLVGSIGGRLAILENMVMTQNAKIDKVLETQGVMSLEIKESRSNWRTITAGFTGIGTVLGAVLATFWHKILGS